jgi:hypothetical protein
VLEEDLDVLQPGFADVRQEGRQAVTPRVEFAPAGSGVESCLRLAGELVGQLPGFGLLEQCVGSVADQGHEESHGMRHGMRVGAATNVDSVPGGCRTPAG